MRKHFILLAGLMFVVLAGFYDVAAQPLKKPAPQAEPAPQARVRWEYRTLTARELGSGNLQAGLNKLGADALELVAVEPPQPSRAESLYIFRRPVAAAPAANAKPAAEAKREPKLELRTYSLKHLEAVTVAQLLNEVLRISNTPMRIVGEPVSNQVLVNATIETHMAVVALIDRLDTAADNQKPKAPPKKTR